MVILGVDPGSVYTGFSIIRPVGRQWKSVDSGRICAGRGDFSGRLVTIYHGLCVLVKQNKPQALALESVFVAKNVQSSLKLGQARGIALLVAGLFNLPVYEYSPRQVKKSIAGSGSAQKDQIQFMVKRLLQLESMPSEDEADASAIALTHAFALPGLILKKENS